MSDYPAVRPPPNVKGRYNQPTTMSQNRKPSPPRHFMFPDMEKPCTPCSSRTHDVRAAGHPPRDDEYYDFEPLATSSPEPWGQPLSRQYLQVPPPSESWDYRPSVGQVTPHYGNCPLASDTWDNSTDQIPPQAWNVPCPTATGNRPTPCEDDESMTCSEQEVEVEDECATATDACSTLMSEVAREMDDLRRELREQRDKILQNSGCKNIYRGRFQCNPSPSPSTSSQAPTPKPSEWFECQEDRTSPPPPTIPGGPNCKETWYTPPQSPRSGRKTL